MDNQNLNSTLEHNIEQKSPIMLDHNDQNIKKFAANSRASNLEDVYEKYEEAHEKESKRLTATMMVIFSILIIIATLFILSYINGAHVVTQIVVE